MKLLVCLTCSDVFSLTKERKFCSCGDSSGLYVDNVHANIKGHCLPVGFDNNSFIDAIIEQQARNKHKGVTEGSTFTAFMIPDHAYSIHREKEQSPVVESKTK